MPEYTAYGVGIESDYAFDALPISERNRTLIRFDLERVDLIDIRTDVRTTITNAQGRNIYTSFCDNVVSIRIGAFLSCELLLASDRIRCTVLKMVPDNLFRYWILQQILPLFLLLNGTLEFLHGMAIDTKGGLISGDEQLSGSSCMGFIGDSYAGKSTLLGYFVSRGHALISDEHLVLSRENYLEVIPSMPFYRPYRAGEDLGLVAESFSSKTRSLQGLFILEPAPAYADLKVQELKGLDAISALLPHIQYSIHNLEVPQLLPLVEKRFKGLAELARRVSIKRLYIPRSMDRLPEVDDFIQSDLAS